MREFLLITVAVLPMVASAKMSIIYGDDNRIDAFEIKDAKVLELSRSIAARIPNRSMQDIDGESYSIFSMIISDEWGPNVCTDQKFADQPTASDCTGFLVGEDLLVTAGHCIVDEGETATDTMSAGCQNNSWIFDYKVNSDGKLNLDLSDTPKTSVFHCKKVVHASLNGDKDFALIQLSRKVEGRPFLKLNFKKDIKVNQNIFVMGHPSGLPLKHAGGAKVFSSHENFFSTNLDTFGGNSGSPVFNAETLEVEGILVRGDIDYVEKDLSQIACQAVNVCDDDRKNCIEDSPSIDGEHVSHMFDLATFL